MMVKKFFTVPDICNQQTQSFSFFLHCLLHKISQGKVNPKGLMALILMTRYASEYDIPGIPKFVKKTIIPLTYFVGKVLGKYKHFKNAPEPIK
jgi:hypothetical protein